MCNETMLLDFSLFTSLRKDETIRACTANATVGLGPPSVGNITSDATCRPSGSLTQVHESLQLAFNKTRTPATLEDFDAASRQLAAALAQQGNSNCTDTTSFAYSNSVALGIFAGAGASNLPASVLQRFSAKIKSTGFSNSVVVQICAKDHRSAKYSFGIVASGDRNVRLVQDAVATWASGKCITSFDDAEDWLDVTLSVPSPVSNSTVESASAVGKNNTLRTAPLTDRSSNMLHERATCSTIQVVEGDICEYTQCQCSLMNI
jgi:chitinase